MYYNTGLMNCPELSNCPDIKQLVKNVNMSNIPLESGGSLSRTQLTQNRIDHIRGNNRLKELIMKKDTSRTWYIPYSTHCILWHDLKIIYERK